MAYEVTNRPQTTDWPN